MDIQRFRRVITSTLERLPSHAEELRDLDAAIGDGDLGITVSSGSAAVIAAVSALPDDVDLAAVVQAAGKAFSTANPSTFAALVGGGLLAASKGLVARREFSGTEAVDFANAVANRISERGKAVLGDKTVLDALLPSLDMLRSDPSSPRILDAMIEAARAGVESTASLQSAKGRAAWVQERSVGHPDPGATAYVRFLEELRTALAE